MNIHEQIANRRKANLKIADILNEMFPRNLDPFFEESVETLNRIKAQLA